MPLEVGTRLGPYEVLAPIGEGAMGEVYRARDGKLGREVALKVLPESVSHDQGRLARFEREARLLASLNHPNVATLYDLEHEDGVRFLTMELVEGETLSEKIARGPMPQEEAIALFLGIADGLAAAHDNGVIHRDLKPANIKITPDGRPKVLDFGLAKALHLSDDSGEGSQLATVEKGTVEGVILGTASYMSPEQARGKPLDARTDIWAFGCCLYESLTGTKPFGGDTITDVLAGIVQREPDWRRVPQKTPPHVRRALERCLQKDPGRRFHHITDVKLELMGVGEREEPQRTASPRPSWLSRGVTGLAAGVALAVAFAIGGASRGPTGPDAARRLTVLPPEGMTLTRGAAPVVAPDGERIVFSASAESGETHLWLRALDRLEPTPVEGSAGGRFPFWSPDGRFLAFFADGSLKKVDLSGGPPTVICEAIDGRGGAWNDDDVIVFAPEIQVALHRVDASGGTPTPLTRLDDSRLETSHRWPSFLPDNDHFLFAVQAGDASAQVVNVGSLSSPEEVRHLQGILASKAIYVDPGFVAFFREGNLMVQRFDPETLELTGDATSLGGPVAQSSFGFADASFSASSRVLAYWNSSNRTEIARMSRRGEVIETFPTSGIVYGFRVSPDERWVLVNQLGGSGSPDVWVRDLAQGVPIRLTDDDVTGIGGAWAPDSERFVYARLEPGGMKAYLSSRLGSTGTLLFEGTGLLIPYDWSPDGRHLVYQGVTSRELVIRPVDPGADSVEATRGGYASGGAVISPDGQWLAYGSNESGNLEIYVQKFPQAAGKYRVSRNGGAWPIWNDDGTALYYLEAGHRVVTVAFTPGAEPELGPPTTLFETPVTGHYILRNFDMLDNGESFLVTRPVEEERQTMTVVLDWQSELR